MKTQKSASFESEIRAHIYQKISEIQSSLPAGASIKVDLKTDSKKTSVAKFSVTTQYGVFVFTGRANDAFASISTTANEVMNQMADFLDQLNTLEVQPVNDQSASESRKENLH